MSDLTMLLLGLSITCFAASFVSGSCLYNRKSERKLGVIGVIFALLALWSSNLH